MTTSMTRAGTLALLAGLALGGAGLVSACSGATDQASPSATTAPTDASEASAFVTRLASATCSALERCCGDATYRYDAAACTSAVAPAYLRLLSASLTGAKVTFDPTAAAACERAVAARMQRCDRNNGYYGDPPLDVVTVPECASVIRPTVARGGHCTDAVECVTSSAAYTASCVEDTTTDGGVSYSYPYVAGPHVCVESKLGVAPGEPCSRYTSSSVDYQAARCDAARGWCAPVSADSIDQMGVCKAYAELGAQCVGTRDNAIFCGPTAYCNVQGSSGACTPRKHVGDRCAGAGECDSNLCNYVTVDQDSGVRSGVCGYPNDLPQHGDPWVVTELSCAAGPSGFFTTADGAAAAR